MVRVRVPATSANIGPGFDSLGIAFNLYNEYEFELISNGVEFEGVEDEFRNDDNIILISIKTVFEKYNFLYGGIKINILKQEIPVSRGLGSSSSCIVAGLMGAFALMGMEINKEEIFKLATELEGHPDNVCPAVFGGMVVSILDDNKPLYNNVEIKPGINFIALIPSFKLSTKAARNVLPQQISLKDGIYNVSRTALLISCFQNGNYELLKYATKDRFHESYRSKLIQGYDSIYNYCIEVGALSCFISGAGPSLMAIIREEDEKFIRNINHYIKKGSMNWQVKKLNVDFEGANLF